MIISLYNIIRGGGGGSGNPDPEKRGGGPVSKNFFSALWALVWFKNRGGGRLPGLSPGSATVESYYRMKKP